MTRGVIIQALELHIGLKMQTKRLLDDREVFAGDKLFDAQGRFYASQAVNELRNIISED